ncbi:hypothetical protein FK535_18995 [Mycolicibacterium sp. 018/SC-01/001]|uniref:hypothetical protein n=1 Tax=Mycolicibacterium sp. 018/SC-01/001 TaxID=2592069 RepID=UPI00117C3C3C|nr:hypothetical protein [Mycolicibacterium sp. 018/SC-01/001]TRW80440.1 hypothetical protein FK535_18995 [Mycolicibacterium sp. 018/SC-01/001]
MKTIALMKRSALALVTLAAAMTAGAMSFGTAMAKADDMRPSPWVKSPGAGEVRRDSTQGEVRDGYILAPAGGAIRQSPIATPSTKAGGFSGVRVGPGIGGW